jgi:hypothetical protein
MEAAPTSGPTEQGATAAPRMASPSATKRAKWLEQLLQQLEGPALDGTLLFKLPHGMLRGVSTGWAGEALRYRYLQISLIIHPDKNKNAYAMRCVAAFQRLNNAYELLQRTRKRSAPGSDGPAGAGGQGQPFCGLNAPVLNDTHAQALGTPGEGSRHRRRRRRRRAAAHATTRARALTMAKEQAAKVSRLVLEWLSLFETYSCAGARNGGQGPPPPPRGPGGGSAGGQGEPFAA